MLRVLSGLNALWIRGQAVAGNEGLLDNVAVITSCIDNPPMAITRLPGNQLLLTWPLSGLCHQLTGSASLGAVQWTTNLPILYRTTTNGINEVSLPPSATSQFSRLIRTD